MSADGAFSFSASEVRACRKPGRLWKNYFGRLELRWSAASVVSQQYLDNDASWS